MMEGLQENSGTPSVIYGARDPTQSWVDNIIDDITDDVRHDILFALVLGFPNTTGIRIGSSRSPSAVSLARSASHEDPVGKSRGPGRQ
eukprot:5613957-Pyramimonas_sp.AAC.1